jgi:pyruvate,water dikinase
MDLAPSAALVEQLLQRRTTFESYSVEDVPAYINGPEYPRPDIGPALSPTAGKYFRSVMTGAASVLLAEVANNKKGAKLLRGSAASSGVVEGVARVIQHTNEFDRIQQGDVVVIPFTNSSFNVVMHMCSAIVTNHGGTLSHAGIVSREMGIPCVTDCSNSTELIVDGDRVEVDGTKGTVTILGSD